MKLCRVLSVYAVMSLFCTSTFAGLVDSETGEELVHAEAGEGAAKVNGEELAKSKPDDNITYLAVSTELATVARAMKDPILMLAAARLEAMAVTTDEPKDKTAEGEAKTEDEKKAEKPTLYALAEEYAGTNETLLALIGDTKGSASTLTRTVRGYQEQEADEVTMRTVRGYQEQEADAATMRTVRGYQEQEADEATMRGLTRGPARHSDLVGAGRTDIYNLTFKGGESVELAVLGDGDTDLDLYVYDENGNRICSDTDYTDQTYCSWQPRWTGTFRVEIKNHGGVANAYTMLTN